jgi:thiol-disulfide isomerase/thioredoxin
VVIAGGVVALVGVAVLAALLWMVPTAAARELEAACRGLRSAPVIKPPLCSTGAKCTLPFPAPDFTAKDMTGKDVKLSDYRGKVVLINFWASWCNLCKTEKPSLHKMASEMAGGEDFEVITLASDRNMGDALAALLTTFAPQALPPGSDVTLGAVNAAYRQALPNGVPFKVLLDPPDGDGTIGRITSSWGITAVPESALIDREGNLRAYFVNKRDWQSSVARTCLRSVIEGD